MSLKLSRFFGFCCIIASGITSELPDQYPKCHQITKQSEVPNFEKCIVQSALAWKPFLLEGIPYFELPSIRTFIIPKAEVRQKFRAFAFDVTFLNISVTGLEFFEFDKYNYELKTEAHSAVMRFPTLYAEGQYKVIGHFLGQQLNREGDFNGTATDTIVNIKLLTNHVKRKGIDYLKVEDSQIDIKIGKASGNFGKLFGDIEILNRAVTQFLKESTTEVFEAAKPDVIKVLRQLIASTVNVIIESIPYDSIFPPQETSTV